MLLAAHALDSGALLLPDRRDVEEHVRRPAALLGLVRLEQEDRRRAQNLLAGLVAMRLRDDPRMLSEFSHQLMVVIVEVPA